MGSNENGQCGLQKKIKFVEKPTLLLKDENIFDICCGSIHSFILTSKKYKNKNKK